MINTVIYNDVTVLDIIWVVISLAVAVLIAKILSVNMRRVLKKKMSKDHMENLIKVVTYIIILGAFLYVMPDLGIDPSGLLVAGGIAGIIIGFASQSTVGNLVSGILLLFERPVKLGDKVEIDGNSGFVEDISILSTKIRTFEGTLVRIPNEKVFTNKITNFVSNVARRFEYVVGIRYADDAEKAISVIKKIIDEHPLAFKRPSPSVFVDNLGDNSVNLIIRVWSTPEDWYSVKMDLLWKIKKAIESEGIQIPFPQRVIWFEKKEGEENKEMPKGNEKITIATPAQMDEPPS